MQSCNHLLPSHLSSDSRDKYSGKGADIWALGITLYCFIFGKVIYLCRRIWCIVMFKSIFLELKEQIKKSNPFDINNYYIVLSCRFHLMTWTEWVFMRRSEQKSNILSWLKSCFSQTYIIEFTCKCWYINFFFSIGCCFGQAVLSRGVSVFVSLHHQIFLNFQELKILQYVGFNAIIQALILLILCRTALNPQLEDLLLRMLIKDPNERITIKGIKVSLLLRLEVIILCKINFEINPFGDCS